MTRPLDCEEVIERLFEFLDRELDPELQRDFEHHIEHCRGCFSRAEFERRLMERVQEAGTAVAPESLRRKAELLMRQFESPPKGV